MHPILFEIPSIGLRFYTYGLFVGLALIVGISTGGYFAKMQGLAKRHRTAVGVIIVAGTLGGAKTFQVLVDVLYYRRGLGASIFAMGAGGSLGVFYGGLLTVLLALFFYFRRYGLPWWHTCDPWYVGIPLGHGIGRIGCFFAGCCWGTRCDLPWAVRFPEAGHRVTGVPAGVPLHPVQLYSAFLLFLLFGILFLVQRHKRFPGQVAITYFIVYGLIRFGLECFRDDPRGFLPLGLSTSQGISILLIVFALAMWPYLSRKPLPDPAPRAKKGRKAATGRSSA